MGFVQVLRSAGGRLSYNLSIHCPQRSEPRKWITNKGPNGDGEWRADEFLSAGGKRSEGEERESPKEENEA